MVGVFKDRCCVEVTWIDLSYKFLHDGIAYDDLILQFNFILVIIF